MALLCAIVKRLLENKDERSSCGSVIIRRSFRYNWDIIDRLDARVVGIDIGSSECGIENDEIATEITRVAFVFRPRVHWWVRPILHSSSLDVSCGTECSSATRVPITGLLIAPANDVGAGRPLTCLRSL